MAEAEQAPEWGIIGMTVEEAAKALRVDRRAVLGAIRDRGLPAVKIGRGWRIEPEALRRWMAQGSREDIPENTDAVCFPCANDLKANTLNFWPVGDIGGALEVSLDPKWSFCVLTFWGEDGTRRQANLDDFDPSDLQPHELGGEVAKRGYHVEPGYEEYVGLYIRGRLEDLVGRQFAEINARTDEATAS